MGMKIVVVNKSTLVSNADVHAMTSAVAIQVRLHAGPAWSKAHVSVAYGTPARTLTPDTTVIGILDDSDQAGALGWHTEDPGGITFGRVFARPVLDNGGDALHKPLSVASVLSHEAIEAMVDPACNAWWDDGHGKLYAAEACDPVESDSYTIPLHDVGAVTVSNFVTPAWSDPDAAPGATFDWLRRCTKPFELAKGGYVVYRTAGGEQQSFAEHVTYGPQYPAWRRDTKQSPLARTARRMRAA